MRAKAMRTVFCLLLLLAASERVLTAEEQAPSTSPCRPKLVIFSDGTHVEAQYYEVRGNVVVFETADGHLHSVSRAYVDLEATERINHGLTGKAPSHAAAPAREGADLTSEVPEQGGRLAGNATPIPPVIIDGPPPPRPPEVVSRDSDGRVTLRALRLVEPLLVDGRLEDPVYRRVPAVGNFIQQEPLEGQPATEQTDVWILFDDKNLYVAARCWDSQPRRIVSNELRRGHVGISRGDNFTVVLDTFYDRRNGFFFQTNPLGGVYDSLVTDERNENIDWDTVWDTQSARFDDGWSVEMAIPFKSLRYKQGGNQVWGINIRRIVQWKNEMSYLNPVPASYGRVGIMKFSSAATLVGLEPPARSMNLELKPYGISRVMTDTAASPAVSNDVTGDAGFDLKYGLTRSLIADFTYNTDFAHVEVDEAQVNLTRFSLFFPEKRQFFLEGRDIFRFGDAGPRFSGLSAVGNAPIIFFSRRIGLSEGQAIPILGGGRLTGRAGPYTIGALNIQTDGDRAVGVDATNFSVFRLKRNIFRRSTIGVIGTNRSPALDGDDSNHVFGVDAVFGFLSNLFINTYYARSSTPASVGDEESYRARIENNGDRYGFQIEHLRVGRNFNPEIGFVRRRDFRRNFGKLQFTPRPASGGSVRKYRYEASFDTFTSDSTGVLETRKTNLRFGIDFQNSDRWNVDYTRSLEFLAEPFEISDGVIIPVGGYSFQDVRTTYTLGLQRRLSGRLSFRTGSFFSGDRTEASSDGRLRMTTNLAVEPGISVNLIDLSGGTLTTVLARSRIIYTMSPRMFVEALTQYNSATHSLSSNIRFRWEYQPGSDLFVVYNEGRTTATSSLPLLENRVLAIKFTRLFRF